MTLTEQEMWIVTGAVAVVFVVMVAVANYDVLKNAAVTVRLLAFCVLVVVTWFATSKRSDQ